MVRARSLLFLVLLVGMAGPASATPFQEEAPGATAATDPVGRRWLGPAQEFFAASCVACHGPKKAKAGLRLDQLDWDGRHEETLERWQAVLDRLEAGEMPPEGEPRPSPASVETLTSAIRHALDSVAETSSAPGVLRRLNRIQYRNTLRDLLLIDVQEEDPTGSFPADDTLDGFDNLGEGLVMSEFLMRQVLTAARRALDLATFEGPRPEPVTRRMYETQPERVVGRARPASFEINHIRVGDGLAFLFMNDERAPGDTRGQNLTSSRQGASSAGWYEFTFEVESKGRGSLSAERFRVPRPEWPAMHPEDLARLEIYLSAPFASSPHHSRRRILVDAMDLPDDVPTRVTRRYWLARGWRVELAFGNAFAGHLADYLTALGAGEEVAALESVPKPQQLERMADLTRAWITRTDAPRIVIHGASERGPIHDSWPPPSHRAAWGDPTTSLEERVSAFATRAFRRPVEMEELAPFVRLAHENPEGLRAAVEAILCSPSCLYLVEGGVEGGVEGEGRLDDHALASRLSYFLWSTMPDERLLALAADQRLGVTEVLHEEVERMLGDPRSAEFVEHFTWGWLGLQNALDMAPDPMRFPVYHHSRLGPAMFTETRLFFRHVLDENLPIAEFIASDSAFVNADLARLYGIEGVTSTVEFAHVRLAPKLMRGGLLGQGAVLTASANGVDTSPVVRGIWVLERLLGLPPDPPPPGVAIPEPDARGELTIRQRFEQHRTAESCSECHRTIDPLGFALESFDAIGRRRLSYESGAPIDTSGRMPGGEPFTDVEGMKRSVLAELPLVTRNLTMKLASYAAGRPMRVADRREIDRIVTEVGGRDARLRDLLHAVVASRIFRER